jgi:hypothetical protein
MIYSRVINLNDYRGWGRPNTNISYHANCDVIGSSIASGRLENVHAFVQDILEFSASQIWSLNITALKCMGRKYICM